MVEDAESDLRIRGELSGPATAADGSATAADGPATAAAGLAPGTDDQDDENDDDLPDTDAVIREAAEVFRAAGLGSEPHEEGTDGSPSPVGRGQARVPVSV
jgi:hypothetical protein